MFSFVNVSQVAGWEAGWFIPDKRLSLKWFIMCRAICKTLLSLTPVYDSLAAMCNAYVDVVLLMSCWLLIVGVAPAATVRIDPSQFMLTQDNHRLMSAPVLSDVDAVVSQDPVLPRTPEMDDIPEHVQNVESVAPNSRFLFTASLTVLYTTGDQKVLGLTYFCSE